jgi:hypothetical protein
MNLSILSSALSSPCNQNRDKNNSSASALAACSNDVGTVDLDLPTSGQSMGEKRFQLNLAMFYWNTQRNVVEQCEAQQ